jgi:hypothetical protein
MSMKIQHKILLFLGLVGVSNYVRKWQSVSRCFCGSSVRWEVVSTDDIFWVCVWVMLILCQLKLLLWDNVCLILHVRATSCVFSCLINELHIKKKMACVLLECEGTQC